LASGHSGAQGWASECPDVKNYNDGLTRSHTGCSIAVPIRQQWALKKGQRTPTVASPWTR